jgi:hypothetical protein
VEEGFLVSPESGIVMSSILQFQGELSKQNHTLWPIEQYTDLNLFKKSISSEIDLNVDDLDSVEGMISLYASDYCGGS